MLTQDRLRELFHYDPDTGVFTNIKPRQRVKVGDIAGYKTWNGYLVTRIDYKLYQAHRLAWLYVHGRFPEELTDHINGIRDDNRIVNLREVTKRENNQNMKKYTRQDMSIQTGVHVKKNHKGIPISYIAQWYDISGILRFSPSFNFKKLGKDIALVQALAYREVRIAELVEQGAYYTNRHGQ